jgi:Flp pilus assembly protein TadG
MLKSLIRDRRGVSAVEFALIAPVMIALYMALAETTMAFMADRRADHVASAIGDLVAQVSSTSTGDIADVFSVGEAVMAPFPAGTLNMRISSVKADNNGVAKVVWSRAQGTGLTAHAKNTVITLPDDLVAANEAIVMSEIRYTFDSPLSQILPQPITFNDVYYLRPRRSVEVTCSNC